MSDLKASFEQATLDVKTLSAMPSPEDLKELYAFYKQSTQGDVSGSRPGFTDFVGRAKYDAWAKLKGMTSDQAMNGYIAKVQALQKAS